jgi:hypothetical protein
MMSVLMKFGIVTADHEGGKLEDVYAPFMQALSNKYPLHQVAAYCQMLTACICEVPGNHATFRNGLPRATLLGKIAWVDILERVGFLHLVRKKLRQEACVPQQQVTKGSGVGEVEGDRIVSSAHLLEVNNGQANVLQGFKFWGSDHDKLLLRGLLRHGYGEWQAILDDPQMRPLRDAVQAEIAEEVKDDTEIISVNVVSQSAWIRKRISSIELALNQEFVEARNSSSNSTPHQSSAPAKVMPVGSLLAASSSGGGASAAVPHNCMTGGRDSSSCAGISTVAGQGHPSISKHGNAPVPFNHHKVPGWTKEQQQIGSLKQVNVGELRLKMRQLYLRMSQSVLTINNIAIQASLNAQSEQRGQSNTGNTTTSEAAVFRMHVKMLQSASFALSRLLPKKN